MTGHLTKLAEKALFVKELDKALLEGRTMLSVHSLKDMPMEVPEDLPLLAFSRREDPRDVLVLPEGAASLDPLKPLGCSSLRRTLQLQTIYPDMKVKSIRGNLQTRLRKLDAGEYAGLILAAAGLKRLGLEKRIHRYFSVDEILPAAGQGILAVQGHKGLKYEYLSGYKDEDAWIAGTAERAFVRYLDGGCSSPVAHLVLWKVRSCFFEDFITGKKMADILKTVSEDQRQKRPAWVCVWPNK